MIGPQPSHKNLASLSLSRKGFSFNNSVQFSCDFFGISCEKFFFYVLHVMFTKYFRKEIEMENALLLLLLLSYVLYKLLLL